MMRKLTFLTLLVVLLSGCAQTGMYYWSNYSTTLYNYKKDPNEKNIQSHMKTIEKIISYSNRRHMKVPPGVYCEYGFYLLQDNKFDDAKIYFDLEKSIYPESVKFVDLLINEIPSNQENN